MLPKSQRLGTKAFTEIIGKGQSFHSPFLILREIFSHKNSSFAVSVSKKVAKLAVDRNKIKRQVYSSIKKLNIKSGHKIIIIMKAGAQKLPFKDLALELEKIFVKSGLLQ